MMRLSLVLPTVLLTFTFVACSSDDAAPTGAGCATSTDCASGLCLRSADFPDGYCSKGCDLADPASCPSGSTCIDDASGAPPAAGVRAVCYQSCSAPGDCQAGLSCLEKSSKKVCRAGS